MEETKGKKGKYSQMETAKANIVQYPERSVPSKRRNRFQYFLSLLLKLFSLGTPLCRASAVREPVMLTPEAQP